MEATKQKTIEHNDQIGQAIKPGQQVAFCYSGAPGIKLGTVVKLTARRVRIAYKWAWTRHDTQERVVSEWNYLSTPERILVLGESLPAELTLLKLKGLLP
jgi:hypothetical protein